MIRVLNLYASLNKNTQSIAFSIEKACLDLDCEVHTLNVRESEEVLDLLEWDLLFMGSGVYTWLPEKKMLQWMDRQLAAARNQGQILPGSPRIPGKFACIYATFAGPHTGQAEAVPAVTYMGQLPDHMGITIADQWYIPAAFVPESMRHFNTSGRLGNIEGRPDARDLAEIREKTRGLITSLTPVIENARQETI